MKYHYDIPENAGEIAQKYGEVRNVDRPLFDICTAFWSEKTGKGLLLVQQRFDPVGKRCYWDNADPWLVNDICEHPGWEDWFEEHSGFVGADGRFPVFNVRKVMWGLRMKPLKREEWEAALLEI